ncbi:MAG: DNA adenine methylase, partial [Elusimicrobia bacterium]|nr:DNA adenine methylase [Elusimicrobiota bacterium]
GGSASQADGLKRPWQVKNTRKLDAIRDEIERLSLPPVDKAVALTSLILALDKVDSTLGHYVSYLQEWSSRSYNNLVLNVPKVFANSQTHEIFCKNIFELLPDVEVDLAYLDPPYGSNNEKMPPSRVRYASYYHLWTTICLNDTPAIFGKSKRRQDTSDITAGSVFEEFRKNEAGEFLATQAIERLIKEVKAKWIILSYSSGGRATAEELTAVLNCAGKIVEAQKINYKKNVMAQMKWTNDWTQECQKPNQEFLFLIEKR